MSKRKGGETAMQHARAWVELEHPGALIIEAKPRLAWIPDGKGRHIPRSVAEDIWGMFDLVVFPQDTIGILYLQITTLAGDGKIDSNARARRKKIGDWVRETYGECGRPVWLDRIAVMAWIPRKHFRIWDWSWSPLDAHRLMGWKESAIALAPLPRKERTTSEPPASSGTSPGRPGTRKRARGRSASPPPPTDSSHEIPELF